MANLQQQYADKAGAGSVYKGPVFSEVLPFQQAWNQMLPTVEQEGSAQINPFINRQLRQQSSDFYNQLASQGGGRFGAARGGIGTVQADMEKQRRAQMLDWIAQRQQGFQELFYNPAQDAFNRAIELGKTPTAPRVPTYQELFSGGYDPSKSYNTVEQSPLSQYTGFPVATGKMYSGKATDNFSKFNPYG